MATRQTYLDSHPSLAASLEDFEPRDFSPTMPDLPSQHSGFRTRNPSEYSEDSHISRRPYSPPTWRKAGSGWFRHHHQASLSPAGSRFASKEASPQYHSADEEGDRGERLYRYATRLPLPASPVKGRSPSYSPEAEIKVEHPVEGGETGEEPTIMDAHRDGQFETPPAQTESNYIRFTGSLDVQQRTEMIESTVFYIRKSIHHVSKSRYNTFVYALGSVFIYWLFANLLADPMKGPMPDLIKIASLAKSFEPVIYYSESGHHQIDELQETGVAVWDLSESIRTTNMSGTPAIVGQLETLSDTLQTLSNEMTHFFSGLESDVDAILIVMEWAGRELTVLTATPTTALSALYSNAHNLLTRTGVVSADNRAVAALLGLTTQQTTYATLDRTFHEFLNVMESSIDNELRYAQQLFTVFTSIDAQFANLHRSVVREQDAQERVEDALLSSLWTRVIGARATTLRKFDKNRALLQSVRDRTVRNKGVLVDHQQRLLTMKSSLDALRRRIAGPLMRSGGNASSSVGVEEQVRGLEDVYGHLKRVRETQKGKKMESVFGARARRDALQVEHGMRADLGVGGQGYATELDGGR